MNNSHKTMSGYYDAGFKHILPIIPPHAPVSADSKALQGRGDMLGKIPGLLRHDGWVGFSKWSQHETDEHDIEKWQAWDCGIGLRCHDVIAVDIDVTNDALSKIILGQVLTWLGFGPIRTGNAPKRLVLFKATFPGALPTKIALPFTDWNGEKHIVEILGDKQQFVLEGVHPKTGKPYAWDTDLTDIGIDGLEVIEQADIDAFFTGVSDVLALFDCELGGVHIGSGVDARPATDLKTADMDLLARAVGSIPNNDDTTREQFVAMAHAVKAAAGGDEMGRQVFLDWANRWPAGQKEGEPERVYDSVMAAGIGVQWLLDTARKHGFESADIDFDVPVTDEKPAVLDEWTPDPASDSIWHRFIYINQLKRFVDLRTENFLDKEQFNDLNRNGEKEKPADVFLDARRPHSFVDKLWYAPGNTAKVFKDPASGNALYNTWTPGPAHFLAAEPAVYDDDVSLWLELGQHLFPDVKQRDTIINWCAHLLQHPGVKPNWHPLVGSEVHGTGKDSFFQPFVNALGKNVSTIRTADIESGWTWWAEGVQLVVVSEISTFERRTVMNRLKSYMAAPPYTIEINKKFMGQYDVPNLFGMLMFTNNIDGVAIEKHDRRFFVAWSDAGVLHPEWYSEYHQWLHGGGAEKVMTYLMQRDLSGFSVKGNAPGTAAKEEMRQAALGSIESYIENALQLRDGPFTSDLFTLHDVELWLKVKGLRVIGPHRLTAILKSSGAMCLDRARVDVGGSKVGIWCCARAETYLDMVRTRGAKSLLPLMEKQRLSANDGGDFEIAGNKKGG